MKRLKREPRYQGSIVDVYMDTIELPNGKLAEWDYIHHPGASAVVAVTDEGKLLLVTQYRNALDRITLEIPAGKFDAEGEDPLVCAKRELEEETGYVTDDIEWLLNINTWLAFTNETIHIYVARNLKKTMQNLDEDEFVDVKEYEVEELKAMILNGEITDAKTMAAILAYDQKYLSSGNTEIK